jgi:hypothetical protein
MYSAETVTKKYFDLFQRILSRQQSNHIETIKARPYEKNSN